MKIKIIVSTILLVSFSFCLKIQFITPKNSKPVTFSELENPRIKSFLIRRNVLYWMKYPLTEEINIQKIIDHEFIENPEAAGIKNYRIRIFDSMYSCGGGPAPGLIITYVMCPVTGIAALFGFISKSIEVSGDFYAPGK